MKVEPAAIEEMRKWYAPPNDRVFQLVPPSFEHFADILYQSMGSPTIQRETVWDIYRELLFQFSNFDQAVAFEGEWEEALVEEECDPEYGLLDGQANLLGGVDIHDEEGSYCYMGGVNNGAGLGRCKFVDISLFFTLNKLFSLQILCITSSSMQSILRISKTLISL